MKKGTAACKYDSSVQDAMSVVAVGTGKYAEVMARFDG